DAEDGAGHEAGHVDRAVGAHAQAVDGAEGGEGLARVGDHALAIRRDVHGEQAVGVEVAEQVARLVLVGPAAAVQDEAADDAALAAADGVRVGRLGALGAGGHALAAAYAVVGPVVGARAFFEGV